MCFCNVDVTKYSNLAIESFKRAIDLDSQFSLYWTGLGTALMFLSNEKGILYVCLCMRARTHTNRRLVVMIFC